MVGEAITSARIAYEFWIALLHGEIKIEPELPVLLSDADASGISENAVSQFCVALILSREELCFGDLWPPAQMFDLPNHDRAFKIRV